MPAAAASELRAAGLVSKCSSSMASLAELVEGVRHTNAETSFTALRKLREAFEDERAPGKCVGTVCQFFALSGKEGNPILEAWERHGAEKAASRVVVYALAAAAALFKTSAQNGCLRAFAELSWLLIHGRYCVEVFSVITIIIIIVLIVTLFHPLQAWSCFLRCPR